jgi:hypothetical protein
MQRDAFLALTKRSLEEAILLAEETAGRTLPRRVAFQWLGRNHPRVTEGIAEYILERVYVDSDHIRPCVDIGVADLLEDGSLLIVGIVAGYEACSFSKNWKGREGPFIYIVGAPLMARMAGKANSWTPGSGSFGWVLQR